MGGLDNAGYGWLNYPQKTEAKGQKPAAMRLMREFEFRLFKETYWPHYFLPLGSKVMRENSPVGHASYIKELHSGRLVCSLKVKTPLIIPDTETVRRAENGHQTFDFFHLNGKPCIPGSEIRGMVSSVFEALSSSCLRVFDEKKRLSWRMKASPEVIRQFRAGRIINGKDGLMVKPMKEVRFPYYDQNCPDYKEQKKYFNRKGREKSKYDHPTPSDSLMLSLADYNRSHSSEKEEKTYKIIKPVPDSKASFMYLATPRENSKGYAFDCVQKHSVKGYLKVTGPNKVEKKNEILSDVTVPLPEDEIVHNEVNLRKVFVANARKNKYRDRMIPEYICADKKSGVSYIMNKRCEAVFTETSDKAMAISETAFKKFSILFEDYCSNAEHNRIPEKFRTILPDDGVLKDGDLIYFREENGAVAEIIPVKISRTVDDEIMTQKLPQDFRPCVHEITDPEQEKQMKKAGIKDLYQHHPDGLCPACALFGTPFYKGRVAFGFAFAKETPPRLCKNGNHITLPLLERARPTWSMPNKASRVPGRKFYVHHQGWKDVINNPDQQEQGENNRSVQAVESGEFCFDVRFENLEDWELGLLIYSLQLEDGLAHKLGMGKALGFGSTEIKVEAIHADRENLNPRKVAEEARQKLREIWDAEDDKKLAEKLDSFFRLMVYIENEGVKVRYPALRKEDDTKEKKQGYIELAKEPDYNVKIRQNVLKIPWTAWG